MKYSIGRECWSEKTFNGFSDNPFWKIKLVGNPTTYGLTDDGKIWAFEGGEISSYIKENVKLIISECKLNIVVK